MSPISLWCSSAIPCINILWLITYPPRAHGVKQLCLRETMSHLRLTYTHKDSRLYWMIQRIQFGKLSLKCGLCLEPTEVLNHENPKQECQICLGTLEKQDSHVHSCPRPSLSFDMAAYLEHVRSRAPLLGQWIANGSSFLTIWSNLSLTNAS